MEDFLAILDSVQEDRLLELIPEHADDVARLRSLMGKARPPVVTVIGKYNHGKSRLLNELIGREVFKVADKRQTVELEPFEHEGVCWLDAPGLDADVQSEDDRKALQAAWLEADIRLFVHAAKEGELDASERDLLENLLADSQSSQRKMLFVLSLVDQLADEGALERVRRAIEAQVPVGTLHCISSTRYRRGVDEGKSVLLNQSGLPGLRDALQEAVGEVQKAREQEIEVLIENLSQALTALETQRAKRLSALHRKQEKMRQEFATGLMTALEKAQRYLEEA